MFAEIPRPPAAALDGHDQLAQTNPALLEASLVIDRQRFARILDDTLEACGYTPEGDSTTILSVGCGRSIELPELVSCFGRPDATRQVHVVGIDLLEKRIKVAREIAATLPGNHTFLTGKAHQIENYPEIPAQVDVALFRRQNVGLSWPHVWSDIFNKTMRRLRPGGIALLTSLNDYEHTLMLDLFGQLGYQPDSHVPAKTTYHDLPIEDDLPKLAEIDKRVAVFYKV